MNILWFQKLEDTVISLLKKELMRFKALLSSDYPVSSGIEEEHQLREEFLKITLHTLRKMNQTDLAKTLQTSEHSCDIISFRGKTVVVLSFCKAVHTLFYL